MTTLARMARFGVSALLVVLAVSACGSSAQQDQRVGGAVVFARSCQACHSLIGNESRHKQGGDLLDYRMSRGEMTSFTREMPARPPLTQAELRAVVGYVLAAERRAR
jgi:mono/diheme cytochrome c family protein